MTDRQMAMALSWLVLAGSMNDFFHALWRDWNSFEHARQKRADLFTAAGAAEGDKQNRLIR